LGPPDAPPRIALHRITDVAVGVDGDTARARSYVDALLMGADGASGLNAVGWYDDELVRTGDGWRIARRHCTIAHVRPVA
jgi:SnoaL-like domain